MIPLEGCEDSIIVLISIVRILNGCNGHEALFACKFSVMSRLLASEYFVLFACFTFPAGKLGTVKNHFGVDVEVSIPFVCEKLNTHDDIGNNDEF